jgi:hypothetical protein
MNSTRVTQLIGQLQTLYRDGWQSKSAHTTQRDALHQALLEIAQTDVDAFAPLLRTGDSFAILTAMEILSNSGHLSIPCTAPTVKEWCGHWRACKILMWLRRCWIGWA